LAPLACDLANQIFLVCVAQSSNFSTTSSPIPNKEERNLVAVVARILARVVVDLSFHVIACSFPVFAIFVL
jgi:hypothetical protein